MFYIYHTVTQVTVDNVPGGLWNDLLGLQGKPLFSSVYSRPIVKRDGDIQWIFLHGAVASCRRLKRMGYRETDDCPFCGETEDLSHIFINCPRLLVLMKHLSCIIKCIFKADRLTLQEWVFGWQKPLPTKHSSRVVN